MLFWQPCHFLVASKHAQYINCVTEHAHWVSCYGDTCMMSQFPDKFTCVFSQQIYFWFGTRKQLIVCFYENNCR